MPFEKYVFIRKCNTALEHKKLCHGCHVSHQDGVARRSPAGRDVHARLHMKGPPKCHTVEWKWDILIMPNISVLLHHRPLHWQAANYSRMPFLMAEQWAALPIRWATPQTGWADNILMKWW